MTLQCEIEHGPVMRVWVLSSWDGTELSHCGLPLASLFVLLQQAIACMALAGPLQWVGQQLGHAVVQLQGGASKCYCILVAGALGVQTAHEGEHVLWEAVQAV